MLHTLAFIVKDKTWEAVDWTSAIWIIFLQPKHTNTHTQTHTQTQTPHTDDADTKPHTHTHTHTHTDTRQTQTQTTHTTYTHITTPNQTTPHTLSVCRSSYFHSLSLPYLSYLFLISSLLPSCFPVHSCNISCLMSFLVSVSLHICFSISWVFLLLPYLFSILLLHPLLSL